MKSDNYEMRVKEIKKKNIKFSWNNEEEEIIKLDIPPKVLNHWQRIVDLIAKIMDVPAALIMRVDPPEIEVLVSSETKEKPYKAGTRGDLATIEYRPDEGAKVPSRGPVAITKIFCDDKGSIFGGRCSKRYLIAKPLLPINSLNSFALNSSFTIS